MEKIGRVERETIIYLSHYTLLKDVSMYRLCVEGHIQYLVMNYDKYDKNQMLTW